MKKFLIRQIVSLFICIIGSTGCVETHENYPTPMIQADSLMEIEPKKTLDKLLSLHDSISEMSEETRVYYDLLCLKARDKAYITHTSDSIISKIVEFYEEYGDRDKLMEAYFYMGRVNRDLQDAPRALEYFHKAVDISGDTQKSNLVSRIYSQMGTLYAMQEMYEEAMPIYKKAILYKELAKNNTSLMFPTRDIARIYNAIAEKDSAIVYYNKALEIAKKSNQIKNGLEIQCEISRVYMEKEMYNEAFTSLYPTLNNKLDKDSTFSYSELGTLHLKTNKLDSASFYLNKAVFSTNLYTIRDAYNYLSKLEEIQQNYKDAIKYARLHQQCEDSIRKISTSSEIRKVRSLYNYQKKEKENQHLKLANTNKQLYISQLALLIVLITFVFTAVAFYWWKEKNQSIKQAKKLQKEKESQYKQSMEYLKENADKLKSMEYDLCQTKEEKNTAQKDLIKTKKQLLEITNQQIMLQHEKQNILQSDFNTSTIYLKFHSPSSSDPEKINESDWKLLQKEIDITYDNFTTKLVGFNPNISELELRICHLIKIAIKVSRMATFLNRSKSSISSSRGRLYKKLTLKNGTPEDLDEFIKSM